MDGFSQKPLTNISLIYQVHQTSAYFDSISMIKFFGGSQSVELGCYFVETVSGSFQLLILSYLFC